MIAHAETFGKYALLERLAVGGMAEIFKAKTQGLSGFERVVAIKRLHRHMSEDEGIVQMLIDEARLAVRLIHPNIGQVFDLGCVNGQYFIVMEYIPGQDMHRILRRLREQNRTLPTPIALYVVTEMLAGLDHAHRQRGPDGQPLELVHRDISPQNIMFSTNGGIKLVDFGIAKARMQVMQTQAGIIKGKFYYMSPEQAHGSKLDRRTDVFAAGMVLYELFTGRPAYDELGDVELIKSVRACDFPPPSQHRPDLDPELERIIMRALRRDLRKRYQSARQLQQALIQYTQERYEQVTTFEAAEFLASVLDPSQQRPPVRDESDREPMRRQDFDIGEDSVIFDASHLVVTEHSGLNPMAEAPLGRSHDLPEDNPFADADEPTFVYDRGEDNPFAIPDEIEPEPDDDHRGRWGEMFRSSPLLGGDPGPLAGPDEKTAAVDPSYSGPGARRVHEPPPGLEPHEATMQTQTRPVLSALKRVAPQLASEGPAPASSGAPAPGFGSASSGPAPQAAPDEAGAASQERRAPPAAPGAGRSVAGVGALFEPENRPMLLGIISVMLLTVVLGVIFLAQQQGDTPAPQAPSPGAPASSAGAPAPDAELPAQLTIRSTPVEAEVLLDGARVGTTPTTLTTLKVGDRHELALVKKGYERWEQDIAISSESPDPIEVELEETAAEGVLKVVTVPPGLRIEVDNRYVGDSPVEVSSLDIERVHRVMAINSEENIRMEKVSWAAGDDPIKELVFNFDQKVADADLPEPPDEDEEEADSSEDEARERARRRARRRRARARARRRRQKQKPDPPARDDSSSESSDGGLQVWGGSGKKSGGKSQGADAASGGDKKDGSLNVWGGSSSEEAAVGRLNVRVVDGQGKVWIDGKVVSTKTPLMRYSLPKGRHKVKVYYTDLKRYSDTRTVIIRPGEVQTVIFKP